MGLILPLVTSCLAPERHAATTARGPVAHDPRALVQALAPAADAQALAALPSAAPVAGLVGGSAAPAAVPAFQLPLTVGDDGERARECLANAIYYEAATEPEDGQRAVAQVVLNRVRSRAFPHSVCGVVYQGVGSGRGCQFSFACDGSMNRPRLPTAWATAERLAVAALNGSVMAEVGDATFYHANYVLPWWAASLTRLGAIGRHIFYRWPTALEKSLGLSAAYAGAEPGAPGAGGEQMTATGGSGVSVHRGGDVPALADATGPADAAQPVAIAAHGVHIRVESALASGVRIHRGEDASAEEDATS